MLVAGPEQARKREGGRKGEREEEEREKEKRERETEEEKGRIKNEKEKAEKKKEREKERKRQEKNERKRQRERTRERKRERMRKKERERERRKKEGRKERRQEEGRKERKRKRERENKFGLRLLVSPPPLKREVGASWHLRAKALWLLGFGNVGEPNGDWIALDSLPAFLLRRTDPPFGEASSPPSVHFTGVQKDLPFRQKDSCISSFSQGCVSVALRTILLSFCRSSVHWTSYTSIVRCCWMDFLGLFVFCLSSENVSLLIQKASLVQRTRSEMFPREKSVEILSHPGCPKGTFFRRQLDVPGFFFSPFEDISLLIQEASSALTEGKSQRISIADYKNQEHHSGDPEDIDKPPSGLNDPQKGCK
ncbi:Zinc finger CCCH domain-containing protein 13, partial [Ophiophagus hannah]